jgi:hypothetical protein
MAKKTDHIVMDMSTGELLCSNCGTTYKITLPAPIDMFVAQGKVFTKSHRNCTKTWTPPPKPVVDSSLSMDVRIEWWLARGERGISSNTMLEVITGRTATRQPFGMSHPYDPEDFRRCHLLLQAVPELREGFPKLAAHNAVWAALVEHWDELTALLLEQMKTNKANGMYQRMKQLGC